MASRPNSADRGEKPLHFRTLGRSGGEAPQQFPRLCRSVRLAAGAGVRQRESEAALVQVGVEGQRALQVRYRGNRIAAIGEDEPQVGADDRVLRFDRLRRRERALRRGEIACGDLEGSAVDCKGRIG